MEWYCALTDHLLNEDYPNEDSIVNGENIANGGRSLKPTLPQMKHWVVELYKAILLYQMKSVCSYYRKQGLEFLCSLVNLDDWDGARKDVVDAENVLQNDWTLYNKVQTGDLWGKLIKLTEKSQSLLEDISQTLKDFIALQKEMQMDEKDMECLRDLFVVDPQDDMETIRQLSDQPAVLSPNISHFFCQSTDDKTHNSATAILRSLVWMVLIQQPHLISHLRSKHKNSGRSLFSDVNELVAMSHVFKSMLQDPSLSPVYFIVDALDECD